MQRLDFIDIAKGLGILVVTLAHLEVPVQQSHFDANQMMLPMFWLVSGYFFSAQNGWWSFVKKRSRQLLLPFVFFNLLVALLFVGMNFINPGSISIDLTAIPKQFVTEHFSLDGPAWFLLALFWLCLVYYGVHLISNGWMRWIVIILLSIVGCWCGAHEPQVVFPFLMDIALTALPFYALGHELRKKRMFDCMPSRKMSLCVGISLFIFLYFIDEWNLLMFAWMANYPMGGNPILIYLISLYAVVCLLLICRAIERFPFIQFIGRHSLLLLCIQQPIYRITLRIVNAIHLNETAHLLLLPILCLSICFAIMWTVEVWQKKIIQSNESTK